MFDILISVSILFSVFSLISFLCIIILFKINTKKHDLENRFYMNDLNYRRLKNKNKNE